MVTSILQILAAILWLASGVGVLAAIGLFVLPYAYSYWIKAKYDMDFEGEIYQKVSEAADQAIENNLDVQIQLVEKKNGQVRR